MRSDQPAREPVLAGALHLAVLDSVDGMVFVHRLPPAKAAFLAVNDRACRRLGYGREELLALAPGDVIEMDLPDADGAVAATPASAAKGADAVPPAPVLAHEGALRTRSGDRVPVEIGTRIVGGGATRTAVSVAREVVVRAETEAEAEIRRQQDRAQSYLDIAEVVLVALDADGRISLINRKGCELLGLGEADVVGAPWIESFVPERERARTAEAFARIMAGDLPLAEYNENPVLTAAGEERLISWHNACLRDAEGRVVGTLSSGEDVTERRRAEERLQQLEVARRAMIDAVKDFLFMMTPDGIMTVVNEAVTVALGRSAEDLIGRNVFDFLPEEVAARRRAFARRVVETGEAVIFEDEGTQGYLEVRHYPVKDAAGVVTHITVSARDVTQRRHAQARLQESLEEIRILKERLEAENLFLRDEIRQTRLHGGIVVESRAMSSVMDQVRQVARTDSTVLILGETGTGKELVARAIHANSSRKDRPLVIVNCAAMPATLVESELFGREKGAYTGAVTRQIGRFEAATGGTVLLDEIGELPAETQAKLLRVLQDGQFERLGSSQTISVDVRILAATNRDLARDVADGRFREDLFYRLNVFPIAVPPLRERLDGLEGLVKTFVEEFATRMGKRVESVSRRSLDALRAYDWPGNIRELRNVVERAMIGSDGPVLEIAVPAGRLAPTPADRSLVELERAHIIETLERTGWRVRGKGGAAEVLALKPTTLEARMKRLGIRRPGTA